LRQLRYCVAVADRLHFTRAAQDLHVAQPALSQQIRRLEAELGLELFARTSRSVALTQAGEAVVARARRILAEAGAIEQDVEDLVRAVAPDHPLAGRRRIRPEALPPGPFVFFREGSGLRSATQRVLEAARIQPQVRFETSELSRVRALAARGLGVALMPRSDTEGPGPRVATVDIGPPTPRRSVGLVWRADRRRAPAAEAFLEFALG